MKYVLAPNNIFQRFIMPGEVVHFSDRCNTTAKRLTAEEAAEYGVSKLQLVAAPAFDPITQVRTETAPILTGEVWVQQWSVENLPAEEAANQLRLSLLAQIVELEVQATPRRIREAIQGGDGAVWLDTLDAEIAALRAQLV